MKHISLFLSREKLAIYLPRTSVNLYCLYLCILGKIFQAEKLYLEDTLDKGLIVQLSQRRWWISEVQLEVGEVGEGCRPCKREE